MNRDVPVPSKIVVMGTSALSLNDRFAGLNEPIENDIGEIKPTPYTKIHVNSAALKDKRYKRQQVTYGDLDEDDGIAEGVIEYVEEIQRPPKRPRPSPYVIYRGRPTRARISDRISIDAPPIEDRVTFNTWAPVQQAQRFNTGRGTFGSANRYAQRGFARRGRGRGFAVQQNGTNNGAMPRKTAEELDRELDDYMQKGKHPKITMN